MNLKKLWISCGLAAGCILAVSAAFWGVKAEHSQQLPEGRNMIVIAHRAGASYAPENTAAALEQAILNRAEMAEVDIQQLSDGTLIVMHDSNFARLTGVDKNVWETGAEEALAMEFTGRYQGRFAGVRIATLDEMLACARGRIRLMIEVKYTGHETDVEKQLIEKLHMYGMDMDCVIGSMNRDILKSVKSIDPGLETVYIAHNLEEPDYEMKFADSYSIEVANMSSEMVERIHAQGKSIYGWTANSRIIMKQIADYGADGIVTDDVPMAKSFLKIF